MHSELFQSAHNTRFIGLLNNNLLFVRILYIPLLFYGLATPIIHLTPTPFSVHFRMKKLSQIWMNENKLHSSSHE